MDEYFFLRKFIFAAKKQNMEDGKNGIGFFEVYLMIFFCNFVLFEEGFCFILFFIFGFSADFELDVILSVEMILR